MKPIDSINLQLALKQLNDFLIAAKVDAGAGDLEGVEEKLIDVLSCGRALLKDIYDLQAKEADE